MARIKTISIIIILSVFLFSCLTPPTEDYEKAGKYREKINKYNLDKYAEEEYKLAEKNYNEAKALVEAKKQNSKAKKMLDVVNQNYSKVLEKGFPPYTEEQNKTALAQIEEANSLKANVAVKDDYDKAITGYEEAKKLQEQKDYEAAIEKYNKAKEEFIEIYRTTKNKMDRTNSSIDSTKSLKSDVEEDAADFNERIDEIKQENPEIENDSL